MTYPERELLLSRSSQHQQPYSQRRAYNDISNHRYPPRLPPSQSLRIECKAEERHFIDNTSLSTIKSSLKPIRPTMADQSKPVQFRSEIVIHKIPESDLRIKRLHVAFHYHDDTPADALSNHRSATARSHSLNSPRRQQQQKDQDSRRQSPPPTLPRSQVLLHQWIDDICANDALMANDDIVFFIKNGEFFARI